MIGLLGYLIVFNPIFMQYDRAVLNFGNVTNSGTVGGLTNANQSMVFIEWDAVMINDDQTVNGSVYWVSAGAEYNSQNEIWIGQAGFTTILDTYVSSFTRDHILYLHFIIFICLLVLQNRA